MNLYNRTVGALPVSIGTSLALESIFMRPEPSYDPNRKPPNIIQLSQYQECYFNVETLLRNISNAVKPTEFAACTPTHVLEILNGEIEIIQSIFQQEGMGICQPVFYVSSFKSLESRLKNRIKFRESTTILQKSYDLKVSQVLKKLNNSTDEIMMFDSDVKPRLRTNAFIMTHYAYDLLSYRFFKKLDLLESHTGVLKERHQFNTKYAKFGEQTLTHLPFYKILLFIFGDKHQIEPFHPRIRRNVLEMSIKNKWTPYTTFEKVIDTFKQEFTHPADLQFILGLL